MPYVGSVLFLTLLAFLENQTLFYPYDSIALKSGIERRTTRGVTRHKSNEFPYNEIPLPHSSYGWAFT